MKSTAIELAIAALIFVSANGVCALDVMIGRNLAGLQDSATYGAGRESNASFTVMVEEEAAGITIPQGLAMELSPQSINRQPLCIASADGKHPHRLSLDDSDVPWQVNVYPENPGGLLMPVCENAHNVIVDVLVDQYSEASIENRVYSDTLTLFVRPE